MAVVDHVLTWTLSDADCAMARAAWATARTGDANALSGLARDYERRAAFYTAALTAFGLDDADHRRRWTSSAAFDPALVAVLAWIPRMTVVVGDDATMLRAAIRTSGAAVRSLSSIGDRLFGRIPRDPRRLMPHPAGWVRLSMLGRQVRADGADVGAGFPETGDARRTWVIVSRRW